MKCKLAKADYNNKEIFVGLDVHQKVWHVSIVMEGVLMDSKTFIPDCKKLAEYLITNYPGAKYSVAYEAGCFGFWIKEGLENEGVKTIVINPADIPTSDKDKKNKTDKKDSKKIALSISSGLVTGIYLPSKISQEFRTLSRRRCDLAKKLTRVKNQIKALLKFYGIKYPEEYENTRSHWSKRFILWLSAIEFTTVYGRAEMTSYLRELSFIKDESAFVLSELKCMSLEKHIAEKFKILIGIPGIGCITAITLLAEIIDINRFRCRDEFLSYLGLTPGEHSSGESRKIGHLSKRCNHVLRSMLIESAWVAIRKDPTLMCYYNTTFKKIGKPKAIVKVARKLAARIRFLLINNIKYVIALAS